MDEIQVPVIQSKGKAKAKGSKGKRALVDDDDSDKMDVPQAKLRKKPLSSKADSRKPKGGKTKKTSRTGSEEDEETPSSTETDESHSENDRDIGLENARRTQAGLNLLYSEPIHSSQSQTLSSPGSQPTFTNPSTQVSIDFRYLPNHLKAVCCLPFFIVVITALLAQN